MKDAEARNLPRIEQNEREMARIVAAQQDRIAQADSDRSRSEGFLARMEALGVLSRESPTIHWASLFITLLFISLETAPVMVKLLSTLSPYRPYDEALEHREAELVETLKQQMKVRQSARKADAQRRIADYDEEIATQLHLQTRKNQLRVNAEVDANEALMQHVSRAQQEIAERMVEEWKKAEMEKIDRGGAEYVQRIA
jgi:hypothetical protein